MAKYNKEQLLIAVNNSKSFAGVLRYLKLKQNGGTQAYIKKRVILFGIDWSHFTGQGHNKGKVSLRKQEWQEILRNRPDLDRREAGHRLRRALMESGRKYKCEKCGIGDKYNGEKITLDVDHIDGNWTNHKKENLRFLCPNCHSQTGNFKNKRRTEKKARYRTKKKYLCTDCKKEVCPSAKKCEKCYAISLRVVERPSKEWLSQLLFMLPMTEIGKLYGVTDNSVRKWCKRYNISRNGETGETHGT